MKLNELIKTECFRISVTCVECEGEAELKRDKCGWYLNCKDCCGRDYINVDMDWDDDVPKDF